MSPISKIFVGYMVLTGGVIGAIMVAAPRVMEFWLKPYFWVIIAVALFDGALFLLWRNAPDRMLSMDARLIGFVAGIVAMVAVPMLSGAQVRYF